MRSRCGSTLIEVVLSLTAGSTVMLLAISLVHQTIVVTKTSRSRSDDQRALDQLAYAFRSDIHLAKLVALDSKSSLRIDCFDGSSIAYSCIDNTVVRERKTETVAREQERFVLSGDSTVGFSLEPSGERAILEVQSPTGLIDRPFKLELAVESQVGRWKQLEQKGQALP